MKNAETSREKYIVILFQIIWVVTIIILSRLKLDQHHTFALSMILGITFLVIWDRKLRYLQTTNISYAIYGIFILVLILNYIIKPSIKLIETAPILSLYVLSVFMVKKGKVTSSEIEEFGESITYSDWDELEKDEDEDYTPSMSEEKRQRLISELKDYAVNLKEPTNKQLMCIFGIWIVTTFFWFMAGESKTLVDELMQFVYCIGYIGYMVVIFVIVKQYKITTKVTKAPLITLLTHPTMGFIIKGKDYINISTKPTTRWYGKNIRVTSTIDLVYVIPIVVMIIIWIGLLLLKKSQEINLKEIEELDNNE